MTDAQDFLAAIKAAPADDQPRLVFADWLDENGDGERAALIRGQCNKCYGRNPPLELIRQAIGKGLCAVIGQWGEVNFVLNSPHHSYLIKPRGYASRAPAPQRQDFPEFVIDRGFLSVLRLDSASWLAHGDAVLAGHPVETVRLTTWPDFPPDGFSADEWSRGLFRVAGRTVSVPTDLVGLGGAHLIEARWPGVTFHLPYPELESDPARVGLTAAAEQFAEAVRHAADRVRAFAEAERARASVGWGDGPEPLPAPPPRNTRRPAWLAPPRSRP